MICFGSKYGYHTCVFMLCVRKSQVPAYLQDGEFYLSLGGEGDEEVEVPVDTVKPDTTVETPADLRHLLSSLRFWIVVHMPRRMIEYVMIRGVDVTETVMLEYSEQNSRLATLWAIKNAIATERMELAVQSGILELVEYLFNKADSNNYCHVAAKHGQIACLKYFRDKRVKWDDRTTKAAALFGRLDCLQYAVENGCSTRGPMLKSPYPSKVFICTVAVTSAATLQHFLIDNAGIDPLWRDGLAEVPPSKKLECLKYLRAQNVQWNWTAFHNAAAGGHLETVKYLHEHACPTNNGEDVCTAAAKNGHIDCLKYLHEQGYKWNLNTTTAAISAGHLQCVQYLFEKGCAWHGDVCAFAASAGQLDCLKYLHERGCPWDAYCCTLAVERGHINCLQYAHENGCEWDVGAIAQTAAFDGNLDCLRYALENDGTIDEHMVASTAYNGHVECLRYLIEQEYPCNVGEILAHVETMNEGTVTHNAVIHYLREVVAQRNV